MCLHLRGLLPRTMTTGCSKVDLYLNEYCEAEWDRKKAHTHRTTEVRNVTSAAAAKICLEAWMTDIHARCRCGALMARSTYHVVTK